MKIRRVDFSPDEWLGGTVQLDNAERGLYITACALIYSAGGAITKEHLRAACRDHGRAFNHQLERLISLGKLSLNDGEISNKRALNELENATKRSETARQNVGKRWNNNALDGKVVLPQSDANHQPSTINKEEKASLSGSQKAAPRKVVSRRQVPEDWLPSDAGREFACDRAGWSGARIEREVEHFRDHHRKKGEPLADMDAGWRTWVMNGAKFDRKATNGRVTGRNSGADNLIEGFGRAAGLGPSDSGFDCSPSGSLLDGEYARFDA